MTSCDAEQRKIPSELPVHQREEWRRLPLDGAENFRDLGGYLSDDGRSMKWGIIYRSGQLHHLTKDDLAYMERLGIRQIADFRSPSEVEDKPDKIPGKIIYKTYPIDIAGSDLRDRIIAVIKGESEMDMAAYMMNVNRQFATDYTGVYSRWIQNLAGNPDPSPMVFHCNAGKDRAGFAAAILLRTLGIPEDTVLADYLKTNIYTVEFMEKTIRKIRTMTQFRNDGEVLRPLLGVDKRYLQTALNTIDEEWGSFEEYIKRGLRLSESDVEALKTRFLD